MDQDKNGFVDSLELGIGLTKMFPLKWEYNSTDRVAPAGIFTKMDFNEQGAIFLSDV